MIVACVAVAGVSGTAVAQDANGGAVDGVFGGLRGTVDATGPDPGLSGFSPPPTSNLTGYAKPRTQALPTPERIRLPKLRNGALPEQRPVALVPLQAYPKANRRAGGPPVDNLPNTNVAALPVSLRRTLPVEADPFAPIGYEVGSLRVFPYLQQSIGYDTNPEQIATGVRASPYSRTEGGFAVQSFWTGQELRGTMYGAYDDFFRNPAANRPDANGVLDYTVNATRDTTVDAEARFNIDTQRPGSPELNVAVSDRPLIEAFGGTLGVTQAFGRFSVGLHGLVDRTTYDNASLSNGEPIELAYQNVTDYGAKLRVAYTMNPGWQPFVELGGDTRVHDDRIDIAGFRRDSDGIAARVGSTVEFLPQLTGTASAGYGTRHYEDPRLKDLDGPLADVSLAWAATPLTTLTINGTTSFDETTVPDSSGIESRSIGATLSHALFRYLTLTGGVIYQNNAYQGSAITENILTESLKAEYHLSRAVVLTGTLSHQKLTSTVPGYDYTQSVALLGVRLQH